MIAIRIELERIGQIRAAMQRRAEPARRASTAQSGRATARKMGWMTGFEPATTGATVPSDTRVEGPSGQPVRKDKELPSETNQGNDHKDP